MAAQPTQRPIERDDTRLDLLRYVRVVWRRRLFVVLPVVFITSITAVSVRFMSPLFQSRAKLHVEPRTRVNSELERRIVDEDKRVRRKDQLAEVRAQLTNRDFLESVVRELGLQNDPTILAKAKMIHDTRTPDVPVEEIAMRMLVRGLRDKVAIKNADANMFVVTVADNDAESAYILAKVITRSFVSEVKRERMEKLEELFKFSSQQSRIYREKVDAAEGELRDFQAQLIREQNAGSPVNLTNVAAAKGLERRLDLDVEQGERRVETLRDLLRQVFEPVPDVRSLRADKEVAGLERRLRAAADDDVASELDRTRAGGSVAGAPSLDTSGPARTALRRRLAELVETRWTSAEPFYRDKIAEYAYETVALEVQRATTAELQRMIASYSTKAEAQPEKELQLQALQERAAQARMSLETFERTVQSAELSETMMATELAGGVSVVDPPEKPTAPIKPNRKRLTLLSLVLALIGGMGTVFAVEYLDKSFKDIEEIERLLGIHVIGTVPRVAGGMPFGTMPVRRRRSMMLASSMALLVVVLSGMALYEKLLRKQHVTVPHARAQEILRRVDETPPAATAR
jgi:uncharacterized protein involved in exopolysaccharide biosynthesis